MTQSSGINKVILLGNIVTDLQSNIYADLRKIHTFSLVTSEEVDKKGVKTELLEYHHIRLSDHLSHFCHILKKGDLIYLEGRIQTSNREDGEHIRRFKTEVIAMKIWQMNNSGRLVDAGDEIKGRALVNR